MKKTWEGVLELANGEEPLLVDQVEHWETKHTVGVPLFKILEDFKDRRIRVTVETIKKAKPPRKARKKPEKKLEPPPLRTCRACGKVARTEKELEAFIKSKRGRHGRVNFCKECSNRERKEAREAAKKLDPNLEEENTNSVSFDSKDLKVRMTVAHLPK